VQVVLVVYGRIDTLTGGYLYDRILVDHMKARGHGTTVLSLGGPPYPNGLVENFSSVALDRMADPGTDMILQDEWCHPSLFYLNRRLRRRTTIPLVAIVHQARCDIPAPGWRRRLLSLCERPYLDSVDGFVFNSESTRDTVFKLTPPNRPFVIAPPGGNRLSGESSRSRIRERAGRPGPLVLLFLGNVIPRKGLLPLVDALSAFGNRDWRLDVVGSLCMDPAYARRVAERIRYRGLSSRIRLLGVLDGPPLARRFSGSHLLCMPFAYEGFGIAAAEAMGFGLPVIGSAEGATPELVVHGENGFLVDPANPADLKSVLERFQADSGLRVRMSQAARRRFERLPTWEASMDRIVGFLSGLAGE
jgi:glycosyltransferase involved in cell wall biosynthesis